MQPQQRKIIVSTTLARCKQDKRSVTETSDNHYDLTTENLPLVVDTTDSERNLPEDDAIAADNVVTLMTMVNTRDSKCHP